MTLSVTQILNTMTLGAKRVGLGTIIAAIQARLSAPTAGRTITSSDTLVLADAGTTIRCNSSSAIALTIPADSAVEWSEDTTIRLYQAGTGAVSFTAGSGVTLRVVGSLPAAAQYGMIGVMRIGANEWIRRV